MRLRQRVKTRILGSHRSGRFVWAIFWSVTVIALAAPSMVLWRGSSAPSEDVSAGLHMPGLSMSQIASLRGSPDIALLSQSLTDQLVDEGGVPRWVPLEQGSLDISPPAFVVWSEHHPQARIVITVREGSALSAAWRDATHRELRGWRRGVMLTLADEAGHSDSFWLLQPEGGGGL